MSKVSYNQLKLRNVPDIKDWDNRTQHLARDLGKIVPIAASKDIMRTIAGIYIQS